MEYSFEIVGVSPILAFLNYHFDQQVARRPKAAYLGAYHCTLDALIASVETLPLRQGWQLDRVVDTVVAFWLNNADQVQHWRRRLEDAGGQSLLIARVADLETLRLEFEDLLGHSWGIHGAFMGHYIEFLC